ncbi:F-box/WD repeat-containing protein 12 isoform X2 [Rhineura floridana]|uniref:F-box/WD repeat-containing protein 12 isoform X2 n=1 Tax=Rhineura floridana TaxID=261503 RepID=UPI002AC829BF|nr:F-box/WD repeat-containing protein 12 isoform X2 [Rhineura floridana]
MSAESLTLDCVIQIFSYLEVPDLLRAAQVNKTWKEAAGTASLWRNMCLRRWAFCNISVNPGMQTWKKYYLYRSNLEYKKVSGRPSVDYTCKAMRGHKGIINDMAYLSDNEHTFATGKVKSVVCTTSSDSTVRAWDVQEGTQIWSSPQQEAPLENIITFPLCKLVATTDCRGMIKLWHGDTGEELAAFSASSSSCSVAAYTINNKPFLTVGTEEGKLYTLAAADLSQISQAKVFQNCGIDLSLCSPDGLWIVVCPTDHALSPKVCYTHCATNTEDELMLSSPLPITDQCLVTCWLPSEPARIAILHKEQTNFRIVSLDVVIEKKSKYKMSITAQQVADFTLPGQEPWMTKIIMKGFGKQTILIAAGLELKLYSLVGTELMAFKDHHKIITSIWVDPFHVVTSSMDLSLRVYSWKNDNKFSLLISRYHLLGGSHRWSSGFRSVACDDVSIVGVVAGTDGTDILRAYSFNL